VWGAGVGAGAGRERVGRGSGLAQAVAARGHTIRRGRSHHIDFLSPWSPNQ
jgi:hypothetical protein